MCLWLAVALHVGALQSLGSTRARIALRLARERTFDGLCADLYNCAHRGAPERLAVALAAWALRRSAAVQCNATFALAEARAELPVQFDVDFLTPRKRTCLLLAARAGSAECCRLLVMHGARVNEPGHGAMTSLHWAARQGSDDCLRVLVAHGGNVWAQTKEGFLPIHWAAMNGRDSCLATLLGAVAAGAERLRMVEARDGKERTPMMYAALNGHRTALAMLLEQSADVTAVDVDGESALHKLASHGSVAQLEIILDKLPSTVTPRALFSAANERRMTPMHVAFLRGHRDFVSHLLQQEPSLVRDVVQMLALSSADRAHWTASQWASFTGVLRHLSRPEAGISSLLLDAVVGMLTECGRSLLGLRVAPESASASDVALTPDGFLTLIDNYCTIFKAGDAQLLADTAQSLQALWHDLDTTLAALAREHADAIATSESLQRIDSDSDSDEPHVRPVAAVAPTSEQIDGKQSDGGSSSSSATASTSRRRRTTDDNDDDDDNNDVDFADGGAAESDSVIQRSSSTASAVAKSTAQRVNPLAAHDGVLTVLRGMYMIETDRLTTADDDDREAESERFVAFVRQHARLLQAAVLAAPSLLVSRLDFFIASPTLCSEYVGLVRRCLKFDEKKQWLRERLAKLAQRGRQQQQVAEDAVLLNVSRNQPLSSSCSALRDFSARQIRGHIEVRFSDERGVGAGVLREWLTVLSRDLFDQRNALFAPSDDGVRLQPNPKSFANPDCLSYFAFAGTVVALAITHEELLNVRFTESFYKHLVGLPSALSDMQSIDADVSRNLQWLLDNDIDDADLQLTFTLDTDVFGRVETLELKPNGAAIAVTNANKLEYVQLVAEERTTGSVAQQLRSFAAAFWDVLPRQYVGIFEPAELELLISGAPSIDVDDWQRHSTVVGFAPDAPQIQWFWRLVRTLTLADQQRLLQFATGCPSVPAGGFARLGGPNGHQPFCITLYEHNGVASSSSSSSTSSSKTAMLPTASTCFNMLRLPMYDSEEQLRERLLVAIRQGNEGFSFA